MELDALRYDAYLSHMIIYQATNKLNGKSYIGLTSYPLEKRIKGHVRQSRQSSSGSIFHASIRKYGIEAFDISVIDEASSMEDLKIKEIQWIAKLNTASPNGYNLTRGGDGVVDPSDITIKRRSKAVKDKYKDPLHAKKHRDGVLAHWENITPEEYKEKIKSIRETRRKNGTLRFPKAALEAAAALKKTPEWRRKMSIQSKTKWKEDGFKDRWTQSVRKKQAEKKDFFIRCLDNGKVFSSARAGADWCRENGYPKAARNNLCLCVNGVYKTFCGMSWEKIDASAYRASGLDYVV